MSMYNPNEYREELGGVSPKTNFVVNMCDVLVKILYCQNIKF